MKTFIRQKINERGGVMDSNMWICLKLQLSFVMTATFRKNVEIPQTSN